MSQILWEPAEVVSIEELPPIPSGPSTEEKYQAIQAWLDGGRTKKEIAETMGVSRQSLYALLSRYESKPKSGSSKKAVKKTVTHS